MTLVKNLRFMLGRVVIHIGLRILPPGRVREELNALITSWAHNVYRVARDPQDQPGIQ